MAKSASLEYEHHVVATRQRIVGSGNLHQTLESYQAVKTSALLDLPLTAVTSIEPMRLANFQSQRIRLVGSVTGLGDWFDISKIIIFAKPVAAEYPNLT